MGESGAIKTNVDTCLLDGNLILGNMVNQCAITATGSSILTGASQNQSIVLPPNTGVSQVSSPLTETSTITATFGNGAAAAIQGKLVTWTRTAAGTWTCQTTVDARYAPRGCPI